jgi:hypothetical protein
MLLPGHDVRRQWFKQKIVVYRYSLKGTPTMIGRCLNTAAIRPTTGEKQSNDTALR